MNTTQNDTTPTPSTEAASTPLGDSAAEPAHDIERLTRRWPRRTLRAGEVLWYQEDASEELGFLESGGLEVFVDGRQVSAVGPGELLGEASAFMPLAARTATVRAQGTTVVRLCSREQVRALRESGDALYDAMLDQALQALAHRVRASGLRLARLAEGLQARPETPSMDPEPPVSPKERRLERHAARLALRTVPALASLSDAELERLVDGARSRVLAPGDVLCAEGDVRRSAFLLADGRLQILRNVGSQKAVPVTSIDRESLLGLLGLLLGTPRNATVIAEQACLVLELDISAHQSLDGDVGRAWRESLMQALREHIICADQSVVQLEARREERVSREYAYRDRVYRDTVSSIGSSLSWPIQEPEHAARVRQQSERILRTLAPHRRLLPGSGPCAVQPCEECFSLHATKVERAVAAGLPIHFILPAFPGKSPNTESKVLGKLPDMAEEQSLRYLQSLCEEIESVYPPGARVTICSDGRVFSDLVLVNDADISTYVRGIEDMLERLELRCVDTFNLEDLFEVTSFEGMRDHLAVHYGEDIALLRQRASDHAHHRSMINGIHRFLFEDTIAVEKDKSRTRIRKETKGRAYEVVQRSNAFSRLIAECFPQAMRLSIHPQTPHSAKIGVLLGEAESTWITPWHGVAMQTPDGYRLVKRKRAEDLGARLVERDGRPSHYVLDGVLGGSALDGAGHTTVAEA